MNSPRVSIVVPSYQQGEFIEDCLRSILSQEGVSFEVLVYDAGSTDETPVILSRYAHRLDYICVESDLGQAHAINKGLRRVRGDIVCYLNSDDMLLPGALLRIADHFDQHPEVDLIYGRARYIDRKGRVVRDYITYDWSHIRFHDECFICQPAAFWRRGAMNKIGHLDESLDCSMDYDYWIRLANAGFRVSFIDEHLACSREYPETKTRRDRAKVYRENFRIMLKRIGYVPAHWLEGYLRLCKFHTKPRFSILLPGQPLALRLLGKALEKLSMCFAKDVYLVDDRKYLRVL